MAMNKLQGMVQKFRTGSGDSEKMAPFSLLPDVPGAQSGQPTSPSASSSTTAPLFTTPTASGEDQSASLSSVALLTAVDSPALMGAQTFLPTQTGAQITTKGEPGSGGDDSVWVTGSHPPTLPGAAGGPLGDLGGLRPAPISTTSSQSVAGVAGGASVGAKGALSQLSPQEFHSSVLSALVAADKTGGLAEEVGKTPLERKLSKKQPKGTFEYTVQDRDTLVKIGAHFDVTPSELRKINKMISRDVFTGQTLWIPDPNYVPSDPPTPTSPTVPDKRPKVDIPLSGLGDQPPPAIPGHVIQVTSPKGTTPPSSAPASSKSVSSPKFNLFSSNNKNKLKKEDSKETELDELDQECLQKFVKIPARRILEDAFEGDANLEGQVCKGTLLVTPNALMFDPDVADELVKESDGQGQNKFSMVVYMDNLKGAVLYNDITPRIFWRQPKHMRAQSPKPEPFRLGDDSRQQAEGADIVDSSTGSSSSSMDKEEDNDAGRQAPDGACSGDGGVARMSPDGVCHDGSTSAPPLGRRTSDELENVDVSQISLGSNNQPGRASKEVEKTLKSYNSCTPTSPTLKNMSRSSELAVNEIASLQDVGSTFGETRDFGPHLGRSSSEVHCQGGPPRLSDSSPADASRFSGTERSDSTSDNLSTPTQGFAPVHFTDRSPMNLDAIHPKAVQGQIILQAPESDSGAEDFDVFDSSQKVNEKRLSSISEGSDRVDSQNTSQIGNITYLPFQEDQFGNPTLPAAQETAVKAEQEAASDETDGKLPEGSPKSSFSPLKTPVQQHISSFFNYTSSLFRSGSVGDVKQGEEAESGKSKQNFLQAGLSNMAMKFPQLQSGFSKEELTKALGPDPKSFLPRSDSPHFLEPPLYLQIRPGIPRTEGEEERVGQPRSFEHRNFQNKMLEEYWFVVPRSMGDKLYHFLIDWQPEAYGDQDELENRDKYFFDVKDVPHLMQPLKQLRMAKVKERDEQSQLEVSEDHFGSLGTAWEVLFHSEVEQAEKLLTMERQNTIDESNLPELVNGESAILTKKYISNLIGALPPSMSVGYNWSLVFSTTRNGYSLQNLYRQMAHVDKDKACILLIKDSDGCIFGAYLNETIKTCETFYGSGQTFLFTFHPHFRKFIWSGENQFIMNGTKDFFAIGSGEGVFGLWVDDNLNNGRNHTCPTFMNDMLTMREDFKIIHLEAWVLVDSTWS